MPEMTARRATIADAEAIADIYNQSLADRVGTFEIEPRSAAQIGAWFGRRFPVVAVTPRTAP